MLKERHVTIVGLGLSGQAAALFLQKRGFFVKVTDKNNNQDLLEKKEMLERVGIECQIGGHTEDFLTGTEILVVSPGVERDSLPVRWAKENNIPLISEIELGYRFCEGAIVAISGTNGKSTVVSILGEIFKKAKKRVFVCGNIGIPFTSVVGEIRKGDIVVLEVSSFQLEMIERFKPHLAIMLNITEDHLDRYRNFDEYVNAKLRLFMNQDYRDYAIANYEQLKLRKLRNFLKSKIFYFCKYRLPREYEGAYVENNELIARRNGKYVWFASKDSLSLQGGHNVDNSLVAGLVGLMFGVEPDIIKDVLYNFKPLEHRFKFIDTLKGIKFIDDSKSTNIDSTRWAIQSLPKGIILIAGGKDKGGDYRTLRKLLKEKTKALIVIGEAKQKICQAFAGIVPITPASSLDVAVREAFKVAKRGDTILLSPMCSSFDMFRDYKHRGEVFCQAIEDLKRDA